MHIYIYIYIYIQKCLVVEVDVESKRGGICCVLHFKRSAFCPYDSPYWYSVVWHMRSMR